jgi:hypothetical protein
MYRIIEMSGKLYAVELLTSGRIAEDELEEIETFVMEGTEVRIVDDYEEAGAELVIRDYEW